MNLTEVMSELDKQIGRLQEARRILAGGVEGGGLQSTTITKRSGPRRMSAAARQRIAEAQRARWAKVKSGQKTSAPTPINAKRNQKKGTISAEGRARIAAAQKKRWAKMRKAA